MTFVQLSLRTTSGAEYSLRDFHRDVEDLDADTVTEIMTEVSQQIASGRPFNVTVGSSRDSWRAFNYEEVESIGLVAS